jgi:hypothetical protein
MKTKILTLACVLAAFCADAQFLTFTTNNGAITITGYNGPGGTTMIPPSTNGFPVTTIGNNAFQGAVLRTVTIAPSVTNIETEAFDSCRVTNMAIPYSVTRIGTLVFLSCDEMASFSVDPTNPVYSSVNNILFDKAQTTLIEFPLALATSCSIPAGVTNIGVDAFVGCAITNLALPDSLITIGGAAFEACDSLSNVTIPTNVITIGTNAFYNCTLLSGVTIPNSVTSIGNNAFTECAKLKSVTIPNSVTQLGTGVFADCGLTNVTILANLTSIGNNLFQGCGNLTSVVIPNSVTNIGSEAFDQCRGLTNVAIGDNVASIGVSAFEDCASLASVTIPNSVTNLGTLAFADCTALTNLTFLGNAPALGTRAFLSVPGTVYYYQGTMGWTNTTFGGLPAVELAAPSSPPQISGSDIDIQAGNFGFLVTGGTNQTIVVEASTNLVNWQPVSTNTLTGTNITFTDPQWTNYPARFYRAR